MENKLKTSTEQIELINQSIRLTQLLRTHICHVFREVGDGFSDSAVSSGENQEHAAQENQKSLLRSLRRSIEVVGHDVGELEKGGQSLVPITPSANCDYVSLDPILDRTPLYSQVNLSYKRANKMHEYAMLSASILSLNTLKRSPHQNVVPGGKRAKRPSSTASMVPQISQVDQMVATVDRQHPNMRISLSRPLGSCAVMHIILGRVLKAQIVLRGLVIEWVKVKGYNEEFTTTDGKVDLWGKSRYEVFQKISDHAAAAMLHYYAPTMPEIGVRSFTLWLQGYSNLFSAPCTKCGKFLQNAMPPTWRDFRTREPFHDGCRQ
ncbi:hypothetical protein ACOMHN_037087 [Nucella lapillus]